MSDDPTNSVKALKDSSWSVHQVKGQSHQAKPSIVHISKHQSGRSVKYTVI